MIAIVDLIEVGRPADDRIYNIVLLVLLGGLIGLAVDLARRGLGEQVLLELAAVARA